jgi:two-component system cell cycle response regulator CpdR
MSNILLADDDASMRHFIAGALQKAGHDVVQASDGLEAFKFLKTDAAFDLLLTDIVMPGMDGLELAAQARLLRPALKVMFITGFAAMALKDADQNSKSRVLSKPFHLGTLVDEVAAILQG